jgi:hypothetical protein
MSQPRGVFSLKVFRRGVLVDEMLDRNLIVNGSKLIHAQLLGGAVTGNSMAQIGYGTGILAPVVGNTGLTAPYMKALDGVTYPASNEVSFAFSLASAEDNGMAIGEFGLFSTLGALYARKTRSAALNKDTDISLSGTWTIVF